MYGLYVVRINFEIDLSRRKQTVAHFKSLIVLPIAYIHRTAWIVISVSTVSQWVVNNIKSATVCIYTPSEDEVCSVCSRRVASSRSAVSYQQRWMLAEQHPAMSRPD